VNRRRARWGAALLALATAAAALTLIVTGCTDVERVGRLEPKDLKESSGLAASRRNPGVFYTHNDSGGDATIFAVREDGSLAARFRLGVPNTDWEDVATDDTGNLYVADTGNNQGERKSVAVHRVREPALPAHTGGGKGKENDGEKLDVDRTWHPRFDKSPPDCEALFIHRGHAYLISKVKSGPPVMFRFPLAAEDDPAAQRVGELPLDRPVTAADLSADGKRLAVLTRGQLALFDVNNDPTTAATGRAPPRRFRLPGTQIEGVTFTPDGRVLMSAESREVYRLKE
jgi:hypothetical protein